MSYSKKGRITPATLTLYSFDFRVDQIAEMLGCHPTYISRQLAGADNFSDKLFDTLVDAVGVHGADAISAAALKTRIERKGIKVAS